jgi:hypothetical protein
LDDIDSDYPFSATIIAVNCDADPEEGRRRARVRWPNIHHHCHADSAVIESLNVRFVPNRMILDVRTKKIRMWWDGEFGRVLHGPWASSVKNPSVGVLGECKKYAPNNSTGGGGR